MKLFNPAADDPVRRLASLRSMSVNFYYVVNSLCMINTSASKLERNTHYEEKETANEFKTASPTS
jgi:hypothetical protein